MAARASSLSRLVNRMTLTFLTPGKVHVNEQEVNDNDQEEQEEEEEQELERERTVEEREEAMEEVFQAVAALKRAYVALQKAHSPWDPLKIAAGDAAVVGELRRLATLRDRFRRRRPAPPPPDLRESLIPYEAALAELTIALRVKEAEIENLKERGDSASRRGRSIRAGRRVRCSAAAGPVIGKPTADLFRVQMEEVTRAVRSLASRLLSLIRAARWDLPGAVRAILESAGTRVQDPGPDLAKPAMQAYVNRKLFLGFEHESFYLEGELTSLLDPDKHRRDCYTLYRDMRGMDPGELLGVLPGCAFGRFAAAKYLAMVHPSTEESLFGGLDQHRIVQSGTHPRTAFYGEFLRAAKAVWLLHLLAFSLDPAPCLFEVVPGSLFNQAEMDHVGRRRRGLVGFAVTPGFKLPDSSLVRARVFVVPGN